MIVLSADKQCYDRYYSWIEYAERGGRAVEQTREVRIRA